MIKKERRYPLSALSSEALLRRLPQNHEKRKLIERDLAKILAGYRGEQSLDYYLSFLDHEKHWIFHDLRLPFHQNGHFFQLDTLILTANFIIILEVKNIFGSITFDPDFHQLIRTFNDVEEAFPDPVTQVNHHKYQFSKWLNKHHFTNLLPIHTQVVISNPQTIIKSTSSKREFTQQIIRSSNLISKIHEIQKRHPNPILTTSDCKRFTRLLLKEHINSQINILEKYHVPQSDLIKGIHCPNCSHIPVQKRGQKWYCPNCACTSNEALKQSLLDYFLLIRPTITNTQFREFMLIASTSITAKLLKSLNLPTSGSTRNMVYHISLSTFAHDSR